MFRVYDLRLILHYIFAYYMYIKTTKCSGIKLLTFIISMNSSKFAKLSNNYLSR